MNLIELELKNNILTRTDTTPLLSYQGETVKVHIKSDVKVKNILFYVDDTYYTKVFRDGYCELPSSLLFEEYFYAKVLLNDFTSNTITIPITRIVPPPSPSPVPVDIWEQIFTSLATKFDEVRLNGNLIEFYANGVLVDSVSVQSASSVSWENITDKPSTFPPQNHVHRIRDMTEDSEHRTVADSDIEYWNDKPVKTSDLVNDSNFVSDSNYNHTDNNFTNSLKSKLNGLSNYDDTELRGLINNKADEVHEHSINDVTNLTNQLNDKVDKVNGKGLSSNDFTNTYKTKLDGLENYDDTDIKSDIQDLQNDKADKTELENYTPTTNLDSLISTYGYLKTHQSLENYYTKSEVDSALNIKVDKISGKGLSSNDFTNALKTKLDGLSNYDDTNITNKVTAIESKIPSEATSTNKLADKSFVNSSIATATATFRGTYNSVAELDNITTKDLNDYAFIKIIDTVTQLVKQYDKYKFNGSSWIFEYTLNNSSFTSPQWATINSGLTSTSLDSYYTKTQTDTAISNYHDSSKQDVITDLTSIRANALLGATALQEDDNISKLINDVGYLTQHQSLAEYTKTTEMKALTDTFGYLTQHQSLTNYYTKTQVDSAISNHHDSTKADASAISDMATKTWVGNQGFLTSHQSLTNYYTKTEVNTSLGLKVDKSKVKTAITSSLADDDLVTGLAVKTYVDALEVSLKQYIEDYIDGLDGSSIQYPLDE